jgi:hypothetical protein
MRQWAERLCACGRQAVDVLRVASEDGLLLIPVCAEWRGSHRRRAARALRALGQAPAGGDAGARRSTAAAAAARRPD